MFSEYQYHLPFFWTPCVIAFFLGWLLWSSQKNKFYFKQIHKITGGKKTNGQNLFDAIKELNNEKNIAFSMEDFIDFNIGENDFKLVKGGSSSLIIHRIAEPSIQMNQSLYICCINKNSLEKAKSMTEYFKLSVENGTYGIFWINNLRKLKNEIIKCFSLFISLIPS